MWKGKLKDYAKNEERTKRQLRSLSGELEEGQEELEGATLKFKVYSILIRVR